MDKGNLAQLICTVMKGDEPLTINWSLKGDTVSSDPELSTTMLGKRTSMLTIASVSHRHTGTYTCRATNAAGSVAHSADLIVNGNKNTLKALQITFLFFSSSADCAIFIWHRRSQSRRICTIDVHHKEGG